MHVESHEWNGCDTGGFDAVYSEAVDRFIAIGETEHGMVFIVFIEREDDVLAPDRLRIRHLR